MRPDGGRKSAGCAGAACMGRRRGPGLHHRSRRRDEGFSKESPASGGVHTPGGDGYAAKTGTPVRATMPGRAFHCGGREGEKPAAPAAGQWLGENRRPRPCYAEEPGAPYGREAPVRWRVTAGERFGTPLAAIVPARGNPAGGVHASDCMRPGRPVGFGGHDFHGTESHPGRTPGGGPAVDDQASDLTPGVTVKQGQCRVPGPQVQGRTGLVM